MSKKKKNNSYSVETAGPEVRLQWRKLLEFAGGKLIHAATYGPCAEREQP